MSKKKNIKFNFGLLCDDVRVENNGKLIAIGIYGSDIILAQPQNLSFHILLSYDVAVEGDYTIVLEIRLGETGRVKGTISFKGGAAKNNLLSFQLPLMVEKSCELAIDVSEEGGEVTNLIALPVKVGAST